MYTTDIGRDFWFDFDNQTLWRRTPEVTAAILAAYRDQGLTPDTMADAFIASWWSADHPTPFRTRILNGQNGVRALIDIQLRILGAHLKSPEDIRLAFEDFGQGVLFDARPPRPEDNTVHMMDGRPSNWVGYRRWLALIRAGEILGHAQAEAVAHLKRCVLLAWGIQTEADPPQSTPNNPGLTPERLVLLREGWFNTSAAVQDWAFATHRFRAPSLQELQNAGRYKAVQVMLDTAAGDGQPSHGGKRRFWNLPLADFMTTKVLGHPLIADAGPDRGARSALVKVLLGTLEDVPQMPLDRPPMSPEQIQFISDWIDAGCPEF